MLDYHFSKYSNLILVNCETLVEDSKVNLNLAILQSPCWDPEDTYLELNNVGF